MKKILLLFFSCTVISSQAQLKDSITASLQHKPTIYFNYGSQFGFIRNEFAKTFFIKAGLDYNKTTKFGLGFNWLRPRPERILDLPEGKKYGRLEMNYFSLFAEYTFFKTYRWEASIPAQVGVGWANYSYEENSIRKTLRRHPLVLYEPMMTIQYRFFRYFAAGCGLGYRLVILKSQMSDEQFTSPVFVVKTKFYFGDMWRDIRHRK
ncbi:MAG: hypothetical protein ACOZCO_01955 [Bacteroidota bacterium]